MLLIGTLVASAVLGVVRVLRGGLGSHGGFDSRGSLFLCEVINKSVVQKLSYK